MALVYPEGRGGHTVFGRRPSSWDPSTGSGGVGPRVKHEDDTSCMTEEQVRVETWWSDDQQDGWYSSITARTARGDPYWRGAEPC